jgi:hypothetical protein
MQVRAQQLHYECRLLGLQYIYIYIYMQLSVSSFCVITMLAFYSGSTPFNIASNIMNSQEADATGTDGAEDEECNVSNEENDDAAAS